VLYLIVPTLVYLGEQTHLGLHDFWFLHSRLWEIICNLSFLSLVTLSLLVLRFTRRAGYRSTPLDFLILIVAILVPTVLPDELIGVPVGLIVVKVIALFFAFEVVIEESRSPNSWLEAMVTLTLLLVGLKSFVPGFASLKK
jgi:UDP-GlcNAc:undecaprenyl-phosphate GlcNAc-1-phosphate transferase